jgi:hypothetical protein
MGADGGAPPDLAGGAPKSGGCGCTLGARPSTVDCGLLLVVALGVALRYKRRA